MSSNRILGSACWACALFCFSLAGSATPKPVGVFVKVDVETAISGAPASATTSTTKLHSYLQNLYASLLADPAISGITVGQRWDNIQPTDSTSYDWSYLDDAFSVAAAANKPVQLIVTPGFDSPKWLLDEIPSCDALFSTGSAPADCGKVTFAGFPEESRADGTVLPLPWNSVYQAAWVSFLTELNARYGSNPSFIALAIAGPVGASDEMIFPDNQNDGAIQPSGQTVDDAWTALIQHSFPSNGSYQHTDQVFIDSWKQAIDAHEKIFSGITLFVGADAGNDFPSFSQTVTPHSDNTLFTQDCADFIGGKSVELMSCEAKTEVLSYFVSVTGSSQKGTQVGGLTASSQATPGDIGMAGVKVLTSLSPAPAIPFWGGAEFDYPASSNNLQAVGCADPSGNCPGLTVEQAAYNVMNVFFYGTPAAGFYSAAQGAATMQYLEVPYTDVQYALANPCPAAPSPTLGERSLQDLYNQASHDLFAMANQTKPLPPPTCSISAPTPTISFIANAESGSPTIAPNTWISIYGSNLAPAGDTRVWQIPDFVGDKMPAQLDGVGVTVNGKAASIFYISPTQVNVLTPPDAMTGTVQVIVTDNGSASLGYTAQTQTLSPAFFLVNGGPYVVAQHGSDSSLVGPPSLYPGYTTPARPGETVVLYGTGFGPISPPVVSGSASQTGTLTPLPTVTIGGIAASVAFAGINGPPGLFQFNLVVPANAQGGDNTLTATYNGVTTSPVALITIQGSAPATADTFYVAPSGNDSWSGTLAAPNSNHTDGPFATFDHARAAVQALNKTGLRQVNVQFRGGTYFLPAPEMFTAADSGSTTMQIVYENYPNESPVFSGGTRVQNWTNVSGNTWKTTLPASAQYFENLFYDGVRRLRPRLGGPLGEYYRIASTVYLNGPNALPPPAAAPSDTCSVYIAGSGWECFDRFQYNAADPIAYTWKNLAPATGNPCGQPAGNQAITGDIEVLDFEQNITSKLRIGCIDTTDHIVYLTGHTEISQNNPGRNGFIAGNRYLVDNVADDLTVPGQWFLDRSTTPWTLTYLANAGENPNTDLVIVPQIPQVLVASGLQYVTFRGLAFEHDNYTIPAAGHPSTELEPDISAAVSFQNSQHITFDSGTVTQVSGTGMEFISCVSPASPAYCALIDSGGATGYNTIENSAIFDVGVLGIRIGDPYVMANTDANVPQSFLVQNNVVEGYGRTIPASFGIGQGEGHGNIYTHNDVYDGYHCAISISEETPNITKSDTIGNANNTISFNHVYNLLQGIMNDAGSIRIEAGNQNYTAAGNKILNNKVHDVTDASIQDSNGYGGDGIYLDNSTGLVDVENNLVYRVSASAVEMVQGPSLPNEANTIQNNVLAYARIAMVRISTPYPNGVPAAIPRNAVIENNLFYFDQTFTSNPSFMVQGGCLYAGGAAYTQFQQWTSNMYWRTDGAFATDPKAFAVQPNPATGNDAPCTLNSNKYTFYAFAQWQSQVGEDALGVVRNPGFSNPAYPADDYSLPSGSPGVGFVLFDPGEAGRSNPIINPPAVPATFPTKPFNPSTDY